MRHIAVRAVGSGSALVVLASLSVAQEPIAAPGAGMGKPNLVSLRKAWACGFEKNVGQYGDDIEYALRMPAGALWITKRGAILQRVARSEPWPGESRVDGTNVWLDIGETATPSEIAARRLSGEQPQTTKFHYFLGDDPGKWRVDVPLYAEVVVSGIAPGITLRWRVRDGVPEFDFEAEPGADLSAVTMGVRGAEVLTHLDAGVIDWTTAQGVIRHGAPRGYRLDDRGTRSEIPCRVEPITDQQWRYRMKEPDSASRTVLDPTLEFSTFLGGAEFGGGGDQANAATVDPWGRAVVSGIANWFAGFPTTAGAFQEVTPDISGITEFVTKFNAEGSALEFSTFFGDAAPMGTNTSSTSIAALDDGSIVLAGIVGGNVQDFPITPGSFQTVKDAQTSGFITKFTPDGSALVFSTFLGGQDFDYLMALDMMPDESVVVAAKTKSLDIPLTPGAFNTVPSEKHRGYVARLSADGSDLLYATQITSSDGEEVRGVAANDQGIVVVGSDSAPTAMPITPGAYDVTQDGISDAYVVKFDATLSTLTFGTWYGGSQYDRGTDCEIDKAGNVYLVGETDSFNLPQIPGGLTIPHSADAFVAKLSADGSNVIYGGYYGGNGKDEKARMALSSKRTVWLTVATLSTNLPLTPDALIGASTGGNAVASINTQGSAFEFSTYLNGPELNAFGTSYIALDGSDNAYITGTTIVGTYPTTPNAYDQTFSGTADVYLSKFRTCEGKFERYGQGCPGTPWSGYGAEPLLAGLGCPKSGEIITLSIRRAWGGTPALLLFGLGDGPLTLNGSCSLAIAPLAPSLVIPLWIPGLGAGKGQLDLSGTLPTPLPAGVVRTQVLVADPGAFAGVAATAPLRITFAP